jgi:hypothetical protein
MFAIHLFILLSAHANTLFRSIKSLNYPLCLIAVIHQNCHSHSIIEQIARRIVKRCHGEKVFNRFVFSIGNKLSKRSMLLFYGSKNKFRFNFIMLLLMELLLASFLNFISLILRISLLECRYCDCVEA